MIKHDESVKRLVNQEKKDLKLKIGICKTKKISAKKKKDCSLDLETRTHQQIKPAQSRRGKIRSRHPASSLFGLTKFFRDEIDAADKQLMNLSDVANKIGVKKRRIYDVVNVLDGTNVISKVVPSEKKEVSVTWTTIYKPDNSILEINKEQGNKQHEENNYHEDRIFLEERIAFIEGMREEVECLTKERSILDGYANDAELLTSTCNSTAGKINSIPRTNPPSSNQESRPKLRPARHAHANPRDENKENGDPNNPLVILLDEIFLCMGKEYLNDCNGVFNQINDLNEKSAQPRRVSRAGVKTRKKLPLCPVYRNTTNDRSQVCIKKEDNCKTLNEKDVETFPDSLFWEFENKIGFKRKGEEDIKPSLMSLCNDSSVDNASISGTISRQLSQDLATKFQHKKNNKTRSRCINARKKLTLNKNPVPPSPVVSLAIKKLTISKNPVVSSPVTSPVTSFVPDTMMTPMLSHSDLLQKIQTPPSSPPPSLMNMEINSPQPHAPLFSPMLEKFKNEYLSISNYDDVFFNNSGNSSPCSFSSIECYSPSVFEMKAYNASQSNTVPFKNSRAIRSAQRARSSANALCSPIVTNSSSSCYLDKRKDILPLKDKVKYDSFDFNLESCMTDQDFHEYTTL
eukprot:CAMPEP_0194371914 /NCGR_PEP_ID=MMETSP0174-20130528/20258_1 /TAXON_ID=216777 /ORGANISM="Proboscia alata, Strain PI-D3" /LENGTH=628 /DNA_ID=CAMNT_0039150159 /DNA_START=207 /DNA_END=2093 /DNA_ORIENTATION=+